MSKISIVTGGGTGIGKAITLSLAATGRNVLICGRRQDKLKETQKSNPDYIRILKADIASEEDRRHIAAEVADEQLEFLVHNAAVLGKISHIGNLSLADWRQTMKINVEAPLFLTQELMPRMKKTRILHISSGAANHPISGWSAYCASKAALYMLFQMQNEELKEREILTGSIRPGIVDTEMQDYIRQADVTKYTNMQRFHDLHNNNKLESVDRVAKMVCWMLIEASDEKFIEKEYDLRHEDSAELWDK